MSVNVPEVTVLSDRGNDLNILVNGYFNTATSSNTMIVKANSLFGANTSRGCQLSFTGVSYDITLPGGYVQLQYHGSSSNANSNILTLGGDSANQLNYYIPNQNVVSVGDGDIYLQVANANINGCFSLLLSFSKEGEAGGGYSNVYAGYNGL